MHKSQSDCIILLILFFFWISKPIPFSEVESRKLSAIQKQTSIISNKNYSSNLQNDDQVMSVVLHWSKKKLKSQKIRIVNTERKRKLRRKRKRFK